MSKGNNNNLKIKVMTTNERIAKLGVNRDEKIANLKNLGLWNEYCNEVKKAGLLDPRGTADALESLLCAKTNWVDFIYNSFVFSRTDRGQRFWEHVAKYGKRP